MKHRCAYCHQDMKENERYCSLCGSDNKPWVCIECGAHFRGGGNFGSNCPSCGKEHGPSDYLTDDGKKYPGVVIYALPTTHSGSRWLTPIFNYLRQQIETGELTSRQQITSAIKERLISAYEASGMFLENKGTDWDRMYEICSSVFFDESILSKIIN